MTREEAINEIKSWDFLEGKEIEAIHTLIPELRESEDERIRVRLIEYFKGFLEGFEDCYKDGGDVKWEGLDVKSILAWLEKQKENANSFTDGVIEVRSFQRGLEEGRRLEGQKEQKHPNGCFTCDEYKKGYEEGRRNGFTAGYNKAMKEVEQKEQKPNIELIQKSWYMEGYHDKEFNCEPKWIIKTGEGGPRYEENPKYGQIIEQKPVEYLSKDKVYTIMSKLTKLSTSNLIPFNSPEYKKINEITSDVRSLLDYPIEQKPNIEICPHSIKSKSYLETDYPIEQKPVVTHGETYHVDTLGTQQVIAGKMPQKPAEWSEEDEEISKRIIADLRWGRRNTVSDKDIRQYDEEINWMENRLKSLRPQSKDEIYKEKDEAFKLGKHQLAIKFMNYLDENRPKDKMSLSNSECEDIDKAFKENDWEKILRYAEKYGKKN